MNLIFMVIVFAVLLILWLTPILNGFNIWYDFISRVIPKLKKKVRIEAELNTGGWVAVNDFFVTAVIKLKITNLTDQDITINKIIIQQYSRKCTFNSFGKSLLKTIHLNRIITIPSSSPIKNCNLNIKQDLQISSECIDNLTFKFILVEAKSKSKFRSKNQNLEWNKFKKKLLAENPRYKIKY